MQGAGEGLGSARGHGERWPAIHPQRPGAGAQRPHPNPPPTAARSPGRAGEGLPGPSCPTAGTVRGVTSEALAVLPYVSTVSAPGAMSIRTVLSSSWARLRNILPLHPQGRTTGLRRWAQAVGPRCAAQEPVKTPPGWASGSRRGPGRGSGCPSTCPRGPGCPQPCVGEGLGRSPPLTDRDGPSASLGVLGPARRLAWPC